MRANGWYSESFRHSLAARGVRTNRYFSKKEARSSYFARDFLKGNRNDPSDPYASVRKSLNAQGYNASEQERIFGIPQLPKKKRALIDVPDRDVIGGVREPVSASVAPLPRAEGLAMEGQLPEETMMQPAMQTPAEGFVENAPVVDNRPIEEKTVSELTKKEKRQLMDKLQTKGVPQPPPTFSTPAVPEMPPSTPFSQNPLVRTPAQEPFMEVSDRAKTVTRPMRPASEEEMQKKEEERKKKSLAEKRDSIWAGNAVDFTAGIPGMTAAKKEPYK